MSVSIHHETTLFLYSFFCGMICSCFFDFLRATRKIYKPTAVFVGVTDIIFWALTCISSFFIIFKYNSGKLRFYYFIALVIGSFLYFLCFSKIINKIFVNFLKIFKLIFKILLTPATFLYKILMNMFIKILCFFRRKIGGNHEPEKNDNKGKKQTLFKEDNFLHKRK